VTKEYSSGKKSTACRKAKPRSPFFSPVPIKTFIPTVAHPAGHMLNIVSIAQTNRGRKCDVHECCSNIIKADVIVACLEKQGNWQE
jgi:hypothetical protein